MRLVVMTLMLAACGTQEPEQEFPTEMFGTAPPAAPHPFCSLATNMQPGPDADCALEACEFFEYTRQRAHELRSFNYITLEKLALIEKRLDANLTHAIATCANPS